MRDDMTKMIAGVGSGLVGARDAALIALGWGSGLRRSELVALNVEDVTFTSEGLTLHVRRAKTDQAGVGRRLGVAAGVDVATDPVRLMRAWLEHAELTTGPLFRGLRRGNRLRDDRMSTKAVALIVQRLAKGVGLDPRRFAAHSLRRGHATTAALDGIPDRVIARRLGHRSLAMTARYIRETQVD
jgi:integrase